MHPHPPGDTAGLQHPGGTHSAHTPSLPVLGAPGWGCKGRGALARGCCQFGSPREAASGSHSPPSALRPGDIPVPVPQCSPWRWGTRGVGRRWPWPSVCGCRRNAGCRGRAPAACVSRPAPAAECTTKTTMAPPPHATGDGDVSSVRETGTLNPLRAEPQTSAACRDQGSAFHRGAALGFWGTR